MKNKYVFFWLWTFIAFFADQITKIWIRLNISMGENIDVIPNFLKIVHAENKGAAWGIFSNAWYRLPFFFLSTLVAIFGIVIFVKKLGSTQRYALFALSMVLGGALGNFVDRIIFQSVTDFIYFYIRTEPMSSFLLKTIGYNSWPAFNIADATIILGLILLLIDMFFLDSKAWDSISSGNSSSNTNANID